MKPWEPLVAALALSAGCAGDPCSGGETMCIDDHTIRRCVSHEDGWAVSYDWADPQSCFTNNPYCVTRDDIGPHSTPKSYAMCAATATKYLACTGDNWCTSGMTYQCIDGYAVAVLACMNGCAVNEVDCAP